ncbi:MAG: hypothetical protein Q9164_005685 [Protoblastenia rupestris]
MATTIPQTMKGILIPRTGGTEVLEYHTDLPTPSPKPNEILIKNTHIGINYIDTYFRTGLYPSPKPEILGKEGAGHILALGSDVTGFKKGERVVWMGTGGYAEYTAADAARTVKVPEGIELKDACAALLQGLTAITLVEEAHEVEKGDWVLVLAASGGVGGWLCQVLRAKGARTIAVVGSRGKAQVASDAGAETVLVEEEEGDEGVKKVVMEKTAGEGVRAVFDGVGKKTFDRSLDVVARKGTVVSFGNASGAVEPFVISRLSAKNAKVVRPTLFNYIYTRDELEHYTSELFRLMIDEKFIVRIHQIYPLKDVARAHIDLEGRKTMGKLLMTP